MHHDKLGGGSEAALAAPGAPDPRSHSGGNTGASQASVKKEPGESQHRDRGSGRYSPPDFGYHHHSRVSPVSHHSPAYHGYHVDKSLLPPTLSGPHSTDLHSQKFDFFRPNAGVDTSEHARGLQTNGLCWNMMMMMMMMMMMSQSQWSISVIVNSMYPQQLCISFLLVFLYNAFFRNEKCNLKV